MAQIYQEDRPQPGPGPVPTGTDFDRLREANAHFYESLEALDMGEMDRLWLHEDWVHCVHPGRDALVGWAAVRQSFEQIFGNTRWIRVTPTNIQVDVFSEVGIVTCAENITATTEFDVGLAVAQATNVYKRTSQGWRLAHHHASPAPVHVTQPFTGTIQ